MTNEAGVTVTQWRSRVEVLEQELRLTQARIAAAEQRAALAERASRDAWAFVKTLRGSRVYLTR